VLFEAVATILAAWTVVATVARTGAVTITLPAELIKSSVVKEQLTSGLTTVFIVAATGDGGRGEARISVRYELWEERYFVAVADAAGQQRSLTLTSDTELAAWWSGSPLVVIAPHTFAKEVEVDIHLRMIPFSAREEVDAQRWLSRTLSTAPESTQPTSERSAPILRALVETSIKRRPLLDRHWRVRAAREGPR
jgi:hypothetical protein